LLHWSIVLKTGAEIGGRERFRIFTNTATASAATFDPNPANNSATATSKLGR